MPVLSRFGRFFSHFTINLAWYDYFPLKKKKTNYADAQKKLRLELKLLIKFCISFTFLYPEKDLGWSATNNSVCPDAFIEY